MCTVSSCAIPLRGLTSPAILKRGGARKLSKTAKEETAGGGLTRSARVDGEGHYANCPPPPKKRTPFCHHTAEPVGPASVVAKHASDELAHA